jgi:transposase InsO family protein
VGGHGHDSSRARSECHVMAVRRRRPRGTQIHSDQGTQFGSDAWRRFCRSNRLGTMPSPSLCSAA